MKPIYRVAALALATCGASALAQTSDFQEGYRKGFQDGYRDGLEQSRRDAVARPATQPAPATAPLAAPAAAAAPATVPAQPAQIRGIVIVRAVYGDVFRQCDATTYVAGQTSNRVNASFEVSNAMCGDPAPGRRKELKVTYLCGSVQREVSEHEHRTVQIDCSR